MQDVSEKTEVGAGKTVQRSKLVAFALPPLLWVLTAGSMVAMVVLSPKKDMHESAVRRVAAALLYAVAPLYAAVRVGMDAVGGFKAAGTGAKVGRVLVLVAVVAVAVVHVGTLGMLASRKLAAAKQNMVWITIVGALIGLGATLALVSWEGAVRVVRKWARIVLYVVVGVLVVACALGYVITTLGLFDKDTFAAKSPVLRSSSFSVNPPRGFSSRRPGCPARSSSTSRGRN